MAEKKRKGRDERKDRTEITNKKVKSKTLGIHHKKNNHRMKKNSGPRLPASLREELDRINPKDQYSSEEDEDIKSNEENDVYELEEAVAEEESKKNPRFDRVENYEYELPEDFEDENVESDDDEYDFKMGNSNKLGGYDEEEDDERYSSMSQKITRLPGEAFEGKKKNVVISEAYPESEYNPSRDVVDGDGHITINDLLESIQGKSSYSEIRKRTHQMDRKSIPLHAPLPKVVRDRLERKATYEQSMKDITQWEPLVKRNREASTIIFDKDTDLGFATVGAIASEFEPRTEFEKKMAALVYDDKVMGAYKEDGAKLLELNKVSMEDYIQNRNRVAKMRSLLFRHELKMNRIKKIKSKMYHRLLKKDRLKSASAEIQMNTEAAKELAMKQEFKRAEERMTLRHKNRNKWAKRILERGLNAQDEGTRAALAEQLNQHALLTRKMKSMNDSSSSDDIDAEEDDENSAGSDQDGASKVLAKAKEKTLKVLKEEDDELPKSGVLSLPFMVRALKKGKEAAVEEAGLALQDYEKSLQQLEDMHAAENLKTATVSGRRVFGTSAKQVMESNNKIKSNSDSSDSENELETKEEIDVGSSRANDLPGDVNFNSVLINEDSETRQNSMFKSFDIAGDPCTKTSYEVAIFGSETGKKMSQNELNTNIKRSPVVVEPVKQNQDLVEIGEESDTDSEGLTVDGILSSGHQASYELPSQQELIREAFAGDDIEEEFIKDKEEIMSKENPEPEKPVLLPGWGQWTKVQKKKGLPSWMVAEHEIAKRKREEALKKRKDAQLKHVIISEKLDKKAEKLQTKALPYPFTSKEVFEQSIRMPIGPEFNPATAVGALNRPEVVKKQGLIITPIKFEQVDPFEKGDEHKQSGQKQKQKQKQGPKIKRSLVRVKAVVSKS